MENELAELLETAIYKEIASEALYAAAKERTDDSGARALMEELAAEENHHVRWLTEFRDRGTRRGWRRGVVTDLKLSDHLTGGDALSGANLQDTLIFAMKKEQAAIDFYSRMTGALRSQTAKRLCTKLASEELRHKLKLEIMYDRLFLGED